MAAAGPQHELFKCLFCEGIATSWEHIFPNWLNKRRHGGDGLRQFGDRYEQGGPFTKKLKVVCRPCNNTWMSALETAAQPALTRMIEREQAVLEFDASDQLALARWAYKTAAVAAHVKKKRDFPPEPLKAFGADGQLPQCRVRIGSTEVPAGDHPHDGRFYEQVAEIHYARDTATMPVSGRTFPVYRVCFRLFTIVFDVMGWVSDDHAMTVTSNPVADAALPQIWPPTAPMVTWPPLRAVNDLGGVRRLVTSHHPR